MAQLTFKKAADVIDRIIDEDCHVYTDEALRSLELGREVLLWIDSIVEKAEHDLIFGGNDGRKDKHNMELDS